MPTDHLSNDLGLYESGVPDESSTCTPPREDGENVMTPSIPSTPSIPVTVPAVFAAAFGRLARRCQIPSGRLDPGTVADYWTALCDVPLDALLDSAEQLARTRVFFPAVAEWRQAARQHRDRQEPEPACTACGGYGVIHVAYHDGAPFDLALCGCRAGRWYRAVGVEFVRARFHLAEDHHIAPVEDFEE